MLLPLLLFAAYGNNRKEEVTSVGVFHHCQRCEFCSVPSCQQISHDSSYKFTDFKKVRIASVFGALMMPVLGAFREE